MNRAVSNQQQLLNDLSIKVQVVSLPTQYPMGSEKHLVQTLFGKETPARALTADIGIVVHNSATAFAVYQALFEGIGERCGKPAHHLKTAGGQDADFAFKQLFIYL